MPASVTSAKAMRGLGVANSGDGSATLLTKTRLLPCQAGEVVVALLERRESTQLGMVAVVELVHVAPDPAPCAVATSTVLVFDELPGRGLITATDIVPGWRPAATAMLWSLAGTNKFQLTGSSSSSSSSSSSRRAPAKVCTMLKVRPASPDRYSEDVRPRREKTTCQQVKAVRVSCFIMSGGSLY